MKIKKHKKVRDLKSRETKCKIEMENWGLIGKKTWSNLKEVKSFKKASILYKYIHGGWLTGEMAKRRRMIKIIPDCPLCNRTGYTKTTCYFKL